MLPCSLTVRTLPKGEPDPAYREHDQIALEAAREGIVLLKNEAHTLPLASDCEIELHGAEMFRLSAIGAGKINPRYYRTLLNAVEEWGPEGNGEAGRFYQLENRPPVMFTVADGNNGVNVNRPNIGMPVSSLVCATWNRKLSYETGRVIAEEAAENGIKMILSPAMNLHRNPLNGRHPEYFSEDPYLAGIMAGYQSKGLEENGVSSCMKHLVANNCESARKRNHSLIPERALRELYLKVFEVAMSVHRPAAVMTAYNACNGCFCAEDEELLQGILRKEFGFDGFVMTDWTSYDTIDIAAAVQAGNCWMTPGTNDDTYAAPILKGLETGAVDKKRLERNVDWLLRGVFGTKA